MSTKLVFFMFAYWHDRRFKKKRGGPLKIWELSDNITQLGYEVILFVPNFGYPERQTSADVKAIPICDLPILRFLSYQIIAPMRSIITAIRNNRPRVIYVRIMWSFVPIFLGKMFHVPVLLEINDDPYQAYKAVNNPLKRWIVRLMDRISFKLTNYFLPITANIADKLNKNAGIPIERMTILPSGANTDSFFLMDRESCCRQIDLSVHNTYVGFVGNLFRHQGIDVLIKAAPYILSKMPDVRFLLVGDGPMKQDWMKKISEKGINNFFIFTGHVLYQKVPLYINAMDICVAPFTREAGIRSPVKVFEYLACGKPAVMSNLSGTVEQFIGSNAIVLVEPGNPRELAEATVSLLKDKALRKKMGQNGREFVVKYYNRKKLAEQVVKIAERLLTS